MIDNITVQSRSGYTEQEIFQQPGLWKEVFNLLLSIETDLASFLHPLMKRENLRIVLTGAGSSAFIGEAAQFSIQKNTGKVVQSISTTDIVTSASDMALPQTSVLMVSFARSGNSPESIAAVELMNQFHPNISHIFITCNENGALATMQDSEEKKIFKIILPESTNDKGLAMTGSFTSMLLTSLLMFHAGDLASFAQDLDDLVADGEALLKNNRLIKSMADLPFKRAVFLGSGPLLGIARECHLKLQELTDGKVVCKHDSFLGFRHGPRVVANQDALLVYFYADNAFVRKYEYDLTDQIANDNPEIPVLSMGGSKSTSNSISVHLGDVAHHKGLNIVAYTLIGQLLGYYKSLQLGLNPDNPSVSGAISRVVQGVTIYHPGS